MEDDNFLLEIRQNFLDESSDMLEESESCFLEFEKKPKDEEVMSKILRLLHSIKGSSKAVEYSELSHFAHIAEDYIIAVRDEVIPISEVVIDNFLSCNDALTKSIEMLKNDEDPSSIFEELMPALAINKEVDEALVFHNVPKDEGIDPNNMSDEDALALMQSMASPGEVSGLPEGNAHLEEVPEKETEKIIENKKVILSQKVKEESLKVPLSRLDILLNSFGEQVLLNSRLGHLLSDIDNNKTEILATYDQVNKIVSELHQSILSLRTLKLEGIFNRLERVARETSKAVGKKIEFIKVGSDLELDKSIVDSLIDPLTHMVRNSIDHGVEKTIDREKLGKNIVGKVTLNAYKQGNSFFIQIIDDGKGLNRNTILSKAIEKGIAKPDRKYLDTEIFNFIFANGFSTKDSASEVSGRGVGMDVVNTMISDLKGSCEIKSILGEGTTFTIRLPMSLAMFNGSIVHIGKHSCVVPNSDFIETGRYENIENQQSSERLIKFKNRIVRAIDLSEELNIPMAIEGNDSMAIITKYKSEEYAFLISKMIRQEKIVLKKLDDDLKNVGGVSGGGILSDGQIALVLDLNLIIENKIKDEMKGAA